VEPGTHVRDAIDRLAPQKLLDGPGIVDYVVGAEPSPGVFVLGTHEDPTQKHYLELYKLGSGPFYCFYTPYHLCHFEVPTTIGRAACFGDATIAPHHGLRVEVVAAAKRDLEIGDELDGLGGYTVYGLADNATSAREADLLPIGLAEGARMKRPLARDDIVRCSDVELPAGRMVDRLRAEQRAAGL
jgi:predicted homoserine dehydrogenase-like protein